MKKTLRFLSVLVWVFLMVSCSKDDSSEASLKGSGNYSIYANATYKDAFELVWKLKHKNGDVIKSDTHYVGGDDERLTYDGIPKINGWLHITDIYTKDNANLFQGQTEELDDPFKFYFIIVDNDSDKLIYNKEFSGQKQYTLEVNF